MLFVGKKPEDDTVVETLASAIRRDISFGVLRPDQKLTILGLRQSYGGSSHSMRETLRMLASEGMVEATNQRGYWVTSATEDDLHDILLLRLEVEKFALKRSLKFGDVMWESRVVAALYAVSRADSAVQNQSDDVTVLEWDRVCRDLALTLVAACESPRFIKMVAHFFLGNLDGFGWPFFARDVLILPPEKCVKLSCKMRSFRGTRRRPWPPWKIKNRN